MIELAQALLPCAYEPGEISWITLHDFKYIFIKTSMQGALKAPDMCGMELFCEQRTWFCKWLFKGLLQGNSLSIHVKLTA